MAKAATTISISQRHASCSHIRIVL